MFSMIPDQITIPTWIVLIGGLIVASAPVMLMMLFSCRNRAQQARRVIRELSDCNNRLNDEVDRLELAMPHHDKRGRFTKAMM